MIAESPELKKSLKNTMAEINKFLKSNGKKLKNAQENLIDVHGRLLEVNNTVESYNREKEVLQRIGEPEATTEDTNEEQAGEDEGETEEECPRESY